MDLPIAPPAPTELPAPPPPAPRGDEFPSRGTVWIFAILAVALIIEALTGVWGPLDIFR